MASLVQGSRYDIFKYKEALEFLEKSFSAIATYDHEIDLHLEAKKAFTSQK